MPSTLPWRNGGTPGADCSPGASPSPAPDDRRPGPADDRLPVLILRFAHHSDEIQPGLFEDFRDGPGGLHDVSGAHDVEELELLLAMDQPQKVNPERAIGDGISEG